jgi:hypothetical protein
MERQENLEKSHHISKGMSVANPWHPQVGSAGNVRRPETKITKDIHVMISSIFINDLLI